MLAIFGKQVNTITNGVIKDGVILIDNGKIKEIGRGIKIPKGVKSIKAKYVMPGLVEAHCHIGIQEEVNNWRGSDGNEMSDPITPETRALDGIKANADEGGMIAALQEGITTAQILPGSANVIGGSGVVIKTAIKTTVDEMILRHPSGMKAALGENPKRVYGEMKKTAPVTRMGIASLMRGALQKSRTYMEKKERFANNPEKQPDLDLKLEALIPVLKKEIPFRVHAHRADDVATAIRICEEFDVKMSWEHATEGHRIAEFIAEKNIHAVWGPSLMSRPKWEMRELSFDTPLSLYKAGVKFAIQTDALGSDVRFLPICAALAVKHGLPYDYALQAITQIPAEILGVGDRVGSLEVGKDADLRLLTGDPLDIQTKVKQVFIDGKSAFKA